MHASEHRQRRFNFLIRKGLEATSCILGPVLWGYAFDTAETVVLFGRADVPEILASMHKDKRGLRFEFNAEAEVRLADSTTSLRGRITALSLRGCFVEVRGTFAEHERVRVKIFESDECIETMADVIYAQPSGVGLLFTDMTAHFRSVLQKWVLTALDHQTEEVAAG